MDKYKSPKYRFHLRSVGPVKIREKYRQYFENFDAWCKHSSLFDVKQIILKVLKNQSAVFESLACKNVASKSIFRLSNLSIDRNSNYFSKTRTFDNFLQK